MAFSVTSIGTNAISGTGTIAITVGVGGVPSASVIFFGAAEGPVTGTGGSVADSASNNYVNIQSTNAANSSTTVGAWYVASATALVQNNTITYTRIGSGTNVAITAAYITGAATTNPLDTGVTATAHSSVNSTAPTVTGNTANTSGDLNIGLIGVGNNGTYTQGGSGTWNTPPNAAGGSTGIQIDGGNQVNTGSTAGLTFAATLGTAGRWVALIQAFEPPQVLMGATSNDLTSAYGPYYDTSLRTVTYAGGFQLQPYLWAQACL